MTASVGALQGRQRHLPGLPGHGLCILSDADQMPTPEPSDRHFDSRESNWTAELGDHGDQIEG